MWVITIKQKDGEEVVKARLCAKGFQETEELRRDSPTISKVALRTLLSVVATRGWVLRGEDVKSAFLQGAPIDRVVYVNPPREFKGVHGRNTLWKLRKRIYGLVDASRGWYCQLCDVLTDLGCKRVEIEPAVFVFIEEGQVTGLMGLHVDDVLLAGEPASTKRWWSPSWKCSC